MVTVGKGILDPAVHEFFDAVRSYDAKRAAATLADDAEFSSTWAGGEHLVGKAAIEAFLAAFLKDPQRRPTFSIRDVSGDGAVTRLMLSVSGRFGQAPQFVTMHVLCLKHQVHVVKVVPDGKAKGH